MKTLNALFFVRSGEIGSFAWVSAGHLPQGSILIMPFCFLYLGCFDLLGPC